MCARTCAISISPALGPRCPCRRWKRRSMRRASAIARHGRSLPGHLSRGPRAHGLSALGVQAENGRDLLAHGWAWLRGDFRNGPTQTLDVGDHVTLSSDAGLVRHARRRRAGRGRPIRRPLRPPCRTVRFFSRRGAGPVDLIFHASDLHFGAQDNRALDWFMSEAQDHQPAAILITGDLTMRGAPPANLPPPVPGLKALPAPGQRGEWAITISPISIPSPASLRPYARFLAGGAVRRAAADTGRCRDRAAGDETARAQWRLDWSKGSVDAAKAGGGRRPAARLDAPAPAGRLPSPARRSRHARHGAYPWRRRWR